MICIKCIKIILLGRGIVFYIQILLLLYNTRGATTAVASKHWFRFSWVFYLKSVLAEIVFFLSFQTRFNQSFLWFLRSTKTCSRAGGRCTDEGGAASPWRQAAVLHPVASSYLTRFVTDGHECQGDTNTSQLLLIPSDRWSVWATSSHTSNNPEMYRRHQSEDEYRVRSRTGVPII